MNGATEASANHFGVCGRQDGGICVFAMPGCVNPVALTRPEARNLAAWLSVMSDPGGQEVARLIEEIEQS